MSLGDLVISLSANTARFESDMGRASQLVERWGNSVGNSAEKAERAIKNMSSIGVTSIDRLQQSFNTLNIKSGLQINTEAANIQNAFEKIKNSGVASASEINRAYDAMKRQLAGLNGDSNVMKGHIEGMNGFSLASVAAIAKIQILYSLINNVMGAITSAPSVAIEAITSFQSSVIKNAALITSMQSGLKDVGAAYKENKQYAEAVQNVLVKMDAETAAGAKQLQLMNDQFVQQGILIDVNNQKQIDGFKNIANALAAITSGDQNKDMQFSQEIRALRDMNARPGDRLVQILQSMDPLIKQHMEEWRKIAKETGNYGLILEKIGPMLQGFAAAQGDINNLWETVKTTMVTIRDQILRGGLSQGFSEIVAKMKDMVKYAQENKEKIQAFLQEGFKDAMSLSKVFIKIGEGVAYLGQPLVWSAITLGIYSAVGAMRTFVTEMTLATGGVNLLVAGLISLGMYGGKKYFDNKAIDERVKEIQSKTLNSNVSRSQLQSVLNKNPLASNEDIISWMDKGAVTFGSKFNVNQPMIDWLKSDNASGSIPYPKNITGGGGKPTKTTYDNFSDFNTFAQSLNTEINNSEPDEFLRKLKEMDDRFSNLQTKWENLQTTNPALAKELNSKYEGGIKATIEQIRLNEEDRLTTEEANKQFTKFYNDRIEQMRKDIAEQKRMALEKKATAEAEIQNKLLLIDAQEKLAQISGPEALALRIPLEQKLADIQKDYLASINKQNDPSGWNAANQKYLQDVLKINSDIKKQFDSTAKGGIIQSLKQYADAATNLGEHVSSFTTTIFKSMEDALTNFVTKGKVDFKALADSIIADLIRIAVQQSVTGPLAAGIGGFLGTMFNGGGSSSGSFGVLASDANAFSLPSFAVGTDYVSHDMIAKIHQGEAIIPASQNKPGTGAAPVINIINNAAKDTEVQTSQPRFDAGQWVVDAVIKKLRSDPGTRAAFAHGGNF